MDVTGSKKPTDQQRQEVLAIIPARGGSKGLPRKNIKKLCGKPLIAYSIEVALRSELIDRVVVSTDDIEISEVAASYGAEVPFLRPQKMALDHSNVGDGISFTINKLMGSGYVPNFVVTLYPTHPFRTSSFVDSLVRKGLEGFNPVSTVKAIVHSEFSFFSKQQTRSMTPLLNRRQIDGSTRKTYFRQYGLFLGTHLKCFHRPYMQVIRDPVRLIDIDSLTDFLLAEQVIEEGLFDFELESLGTRRPQSKLQMQPFEASRFYKNTKKRISSVNR